MTDDRMVGALGISGLSVREDGRTGLDSGNAGKKATDLVAGVVNTAVGFLSGDACDEYDEEAVSKNAEEPELSLEAAEDMVLKWNDGREEMIWESSSEEFEAYLKAVDKLQGLSLLSQGPAVDRALNALKPAARRLKDEFKHLLAIHSECVDPSWLPESFSAPSFSSTADAAEEDEGEAGEQSMREQSCIIDLLPPAIVTDLSDIAHRMVVLGHGKDCIEAYMLVRKGVLEDSMYLLGVERIGPDEIQRMTWEVLEPRLKKWIKGLKVSVRVLFASERFLCDEVFAAHPEEGDACICDMANEAALEILRIFAEVAAGPELPERLFKLLDMYETMKDLLPLIGSIFQGQACSEVPQEAANVLQLLGEAVKGTFMKLKNAIENDTSKSAVAGGALHPLSRYVMNYLGLLSVYLDTLKELYGHEHDGAGSFREDVNAMGEGLAESENESSHQSALEAQVMLVLDALLKNMDEKSKLYKDPALGIIFLMNNIHYIVQKVKASELQTVIGDHWIRKHSSLVRYYAINYQRLAWGRIFSFLRDEGIRGSSTFNVSKEVLKDRFKSFNTAFEEIHRTQSTWVVAEVKLRDELRVQITDKLLPAYRSFLGRYRVHLESLKHSERYLKYSAEDLEDYLNDLFEGASGSMNRRRSFSG